jgi:hypothetical protein
MVLAVHEGCMYFKGEVEAACHHVPTGAVLRLRTSMSPITGPFRLTLGNCVKPEKHVTTATPQSQGIEEGGFWPKKKPPERLQKRQTTVSKGFRIDMAHCFIRF